MTDTKTYTAEEAAALLGKPEQLPKRLSASQMPASWVSADEREQDIAKRFRTDTASHQMTVLHNDGLYRHIRFRQTKHSAYWFDLVTWPGALHIRGDLGNNYTFQRLPDMFEFFRSRRGGINAHYWAQKLDSGSDSVKTYSEDLFRQLVVEHFVDSVRWSDAPRGLGKEIRAEILDQDLSDEGEARGLLESFEFKGFKFHDVWEWSFGDWDWSFIWACHAIVWGIRRYDNVRGYGLERLAEPAPAREAVAA
ncbi:hypothetical protein GCM10010400_76590 [Streptomyces aculeolatus]|uniref:hypothetical protein n=1 Tax=Streptomyces aculeolatus TaxID=270689 RepID=UPI001CEDD796|nr:hypothetical protein [Streptomyces aculeolatus]